LRDIFLRIAFLIFLLQYFSSCLSINEGTIPNKYFDNLRDLKFDQNYSNCDPINKSPDRLYELLSRLNEVVQDNGQTLNSESDLLKLEIRNLTNLEYTIQHLIIGYETMFYRNDRVSSYIHFTKAYDYSKNLNNKSLKRFCLISILQFYREGILQSNNEFLPYLNEYKKQCDSPEDFLLYYSYLFNLTAQKERYYKDKFENYELFKSVFKKMDSTSKFINQSNRILIFYYFDKGNFNVKYNAEKGIFYYQKSYALTKDSNFYKPLRFDLLMNLARAQERLKNYKEAVRLVNIAKPYINVNNTNNDLYTMYAYKGDYFKGLKMYDSAFICSDTVRSLGYILKTQDHNAEVSMMKVRLETSKKEKESQRNMSLFIGALIVMLSGSIIAVMIVQNSKKRRLIAIKEKQLETQKNLNLIKEQEIQLINAMIEGQEKERKRVAEDLHDNLGNVIATLKMHFQNIRINRAKQKLNREELYNKTEDLIDEAYQKVRNIAHIKNTGVIANQGLLVAVKLMAEKVSAANTLQIEVIDYGLEKSIENSLEITLFRIIQELTTNIIKHARAKMVTINITHGNNDITILIEDDGIGMDISKINLKKGMGLHSIKSRVDHLNGSFIIDSTPSKGTTCIINIPI
jgi:signal transduction histidine kinase